MSTAEDHYLVTTRLLTLLNVSALSTKKRKRDDERQETLPPAKKLNAKKTSGVQISDATDQDISMGKEVSMTADGKQGPIDELKEPEIVDDPYNSHFGAEPKELTEQARVAVNERKWTTSKRRRGKLGEISVQALVGTSNEDTKAGLPLLEKLHVLFEEQQAASTDADLRRDLLSSISSYQDLYVTKQPLTSRRIHREIVSLHILNHIMKIRRRILKNNEKLANAPKDDVTDPSQFLDQGFVRPSILIIAPFRSSAHQWVTAFLKQVPSHQVENRARFFADFSLPNGAEDKLLTAPAGTYPEDHVANMSGNIDDHFRIGIKVTRKTIKMFSDFYSSDIILTSPLGLRELIEKEKSADYLSSIEILVVDQLDALTMQNWNHLQLIFKYLNAMPKDSHDTDFSRIKPWYLDGHAAYLRQSILFSAYETPEIRAIYNKELRNISGKQRTEAVWRPIQVPEGIRQSFIQFECNTAQNEVNKRFEHFTTQVFPSLLRSAVQSVNTVIFIPSYFDYARIRNWIKGQASVSFAVLSEDSDNRDISRARQAFFTGAKAMLLVTERFHFFRRYKLRGIRSLVFYAPPDHPQFYSEFLSYPFLDEGVQAEDITCKVLYSKYDYMRLERIVGSTEVAKLIAA